MRIKQKYLAVLVTLAVTLFSGARVFGAESPTTKPTTRPVGFAIHGTVKIAAGWDLQTPDLTRVVVFLDSDPVLDAVPHQFDHATVAQKNKAFYPNFTVVPRATDVEFPNWDDFDHNVFSRSKAAPAFDLDRYPKGQSKTRNFDKVGVVQVFCNIHPKMRAIVFVVPNIYYTRAAADGTFQIDDVPPGHYQVVAWQERCGEQSAAVDVKPAPAQSADVVITLAEEREKSLQSESPQHDTGYGVERGLGIKREKLNLPVVTNAHPALDPEK